MMLVYFKNRHGQVAEIDVEPQETMREVVKKTEKLGGIEKVRINMIKYSCSCDNDLTKILLDDDFELSRKRLEILKTQLTTRISQFDSITQ